MSVTIYSPGKYEAQAVCEHCGNGSKAVHVGYAEAVKGREGAYPTLARALVGATPAHNPKIEWVDGGAFFAENYCQIVRTPFSSKTQTEDEALADHLASVEQIILFGKPALGVLGRDPRTCGGVYHYLGRAPRPEDDIRLRPLRDLVFLSNRQANDVDDRVHEWLSEISLQVNRA